MKPSQVMVVSNQYKMTLSEDCNVSQYPIEIQGMEMWDPDLVQRIVKAQHQQHLPMARLMCTHSIRTMAVQHITDFK